jgi:hypothetical protein
VRLTQVQDYQFDVDFGTPGPALRADGRLRVLGLKARLTLGVPANAIEHLERLLGGFESCCTVTQSVSPAIPVLVEVFDALGTRLK